MRSILIAILFPVFAFSQQLEFIHGIATDETIYQEVQVNVPIKRNISLSASMLHSYYIHPNIDWEKLSVKGGIFADFEKVTTRVGVESYGTKRPLPFVDFGIKLDRLRVFYHVYPWVWKPSLILNYNTKEFRIGFKMTVFESKVEKYLLR